MFIVLADSLVASTVGANGGWRRGWLVASIVNNLGQQLGSASGQLLLGLLGRLIVSLSSLGVAWMLLMLLLWLLLLLLSMVVWRRRRRRRVAGRLKRALSSVWLSMLRWWSVVEDIADGRELVGRMLRGVRGAILAGVGARRIRVVMLGKAVTKRSRLDSTVAAELSVVGGNDRAWAVLLSIRQSWSGWESL